MPLSTFPSPKKDPRFSFPNRFGIPDQIFNAIVRQCQIQIDASPISGGSLVVIDDADYVIGSADTHILYKRLTTNRSLTIPAASSNANRAIVIGHGGGGLFLVNLSVTIRENDTTTTSSLGPTAHRIMIMSDGTDWWIVLSP